jgi:hypothetical protein
MPERHTTLPRLVQFCAGQSGVRLTTNSNARECLSHLATSSIQLGALGFHGP